MKTITMSLDPNDTGFDTRVTKTPVTLDGGPFDMYRVTYTAKPGIAGERRRITGMRAPVVARLRSVGYEIEVSR